MLANTTLLDPLISDSIAYYDKNAEHFFNTTVEYDVSQLYDLFLPYLAEGAKILDAGCGSGRDALYFHQKGYDLTAFDGSQKLAELARKFTGLKIDHKYFSAVDYGEEFDAIWTSASLLHVPKTDLHEALKKLKKALKPGGVWYLSFRHGEGESIEEGRYFNDQTEMSLRTLLDELGDLEVIHMNIPDLKSRRGYKFVVCIVRKGEIAPMSEG